MLSAKEKIEQKEQDLSNNPNYSFKPHINLSSTFLSETNINRVLESKKDKFNRLYNYKDVIKEKKNR
jgi:hypothetical protein